MECVSGAVAIYSQHASRTVSRSVANKWTIMSDSFSFSCHPDVPSSANIEFRLNSKTGCYSFLFPVRFYFFLFHYFPFDNIFFLHHLFFSLVFFYHFFPYYSFPFFSSVFFFIFIPFPFLFQSRCFFVFF